MTTREPGLTSPQDAAADGPAPQADSLEVR